MIHEEREKKRAARKSLRKPSKSQKNNKIPLSPKKASYESKDFYKDHEYQYSFSPKVVDKKYK
jgi:hypothetical protein